MCAALGSFVLPPLALQSLCQAPAAADSYESASEKLCCLFETAELAVVEVIHQGNIFSPCSFDSLVSISASQVEPEHSNHSLCNWVGLQLHLDLFRQRMS